MLYDKFEVNGDLGEGTGADRIAPEVRANEKAMSTGKAFCDLANSFKNRKSKRDSKYQRKSASKQRFKVKCLSAQLCFA
jgi:hypothetical protein